MTSAGSASAPPAPGSRGYDRPDPPRGCTCSARCSALADSPRTCTALHVKEDASHTERQLVTQHLIVRIFCVVGIAEEVQGPRDDEAVVMTRLDSSDQHDVLRVVLTDTLVTYGRCRIVTSNHRHRKDIARVDSHPLPLISDRARASGKVSNQARDLQSRETGLRYLHIVGSLELCVLHIPRLRYCCEMINDNTALRIDLHTNIARNSTDKARWI